MGFDIERVSGLGKILKINSVEKKRGVKEAAPTKEGTDEVSISQKAMDYALVAKALQKVKAMPDIREEKVNSIKEKINSDNYDVKGNDIADKLLSRKQMK